MNWEQAWERDRYEVGRAMHEGWKRQKIANGFADHPFEKNPHHGEWRQGDATACLHCPKNSLWHHADMADWDDLPPEQQAIDFEGGREGYRVGFQAGAAYVVGEMEARGILSER